MQANKAPQRKRQACSARRRKSHPSHRARAWARALMKCCVVGDHLPPTSTARTTRRDLTRRPTSSGHLFPPPAGLPEQRQPIHCHFESASIGCDGCVEVQVTQQHVSQRKNPCGVHQIQSLQRFPQRWTSGNHDLQCCVRDWMGTSSPTVDFFAVQNFCVLLVSRQVHIKFMLAWGATHPRFEP